jgi:hypothetical protein
MPNAQTHRPAAWDVGEDVDEDGGDTLLYLHLKGAAKMWLCIT